MIRSKLLENFRIRTAREGYVRFTKDIHKWQMLYLNLVDDIPVHCDIKGRQVGLTSFYKVLATYYFLLESQPFHVGYYTPNRSMMSTAVIRNNIDMMNISLNQNNKHRIVRANGSKISFRGIQSLSHPQGYADIMFVDEFFFADHRKELLEELIHHISKAPYRKLFIGGSLTNEFTQDAKLIKHINRIPIDISRKFIINEREDIELKDFNMLGIDKVMYQYRPDVLFNLLEDDYSSNFEVIG